MKTTVESKLILAGIILLMLFGSTVPVHAQIPNARLDSGGSPVFPLLGLISGWFRRNRTYRNAESFIKANNAEYDDMLTTLDQQLAAGKIFTTKGSDPDAQQAAFVEVKALIEQERKQMNDFAEGIKKQARHDFNKAAKEQIVSLVMSTGFAQNILGALNTGFGQAQQLVNGAISALSGEGGGDVASQISGLRNVASQLQLVGGLIGGETGANLNSTVQGILDKINSGLDVVKDNLNDVKSGLSNVQSQIQSLMAQGYLPTSSEVTQSVVLQLVGLGPGTATTEALLNLLGIRGGTSSKAFRDRARLLLESGENVRCRKIVTDLLANFRALEDSTADEDNSNTSSDACTAIQDSDLVTSTSEEPSPTTGKNQGASTTQVSAQECDASSLISVSSNGVTWSNDGTKCYEDLVFNLNDETSESVAIYLHEITTGTNADDLWREEAVLGGDQRSSGGPENYSFPDEVKENTEFIAFYNDNRCMAASDDPANAGLAIVPIPSHCP